MWLEYRVKGVTKALQVFYFLFLGLYLQHMEVPRLGVASELQLVQQHQI